MKHTADIAVLGAFAYDQIATTQRPLDVQSLRNAKLRTLRRDFGGCAGNIAYSCARHNIDVFALGSLGDLDAQPYLQHLEELGVPQQGILRLPGMSAQGLVITDPNGDQFTGFFPGPDLPVEPWRAHLASLQTTILASRFIIHAPFPAELTRCSFELTDASWQGDLVWCPGQYMDMLSPQELDEMLPGVDLVVGNAWEIEYLQENASPHDTLMLKTDGAAPICLLHNEQTVWTHPVPEPSVVEDPTGCGDALIAALMCQLVQRGQSLSPDTIHQALPDAISHAQRCLAVSGCQAF